MSPWYPGFGINCRRVDQVHSLHKSTVPVPISAVLSPYKQEKERKDQLNILQVTMYFLWTLIGNVALNLWSHQHYWLPKVSEIVLSVFVTFRHTHTHRHKHSSLCGRGVKENAWVSTKSLKAVIDFKHCGFFTVECFCRVTELSVCTFL